MFNRLKKHPDITLLQSETKRISNQDQMICMYKDLIDEHMRVFGIKAEEVVYSNLCPLCNTRIDSKGWCACDTIGGD
jgi:hypothetical protein